MRDGMGFRNKGCCSTVAFLQHPLLFSVFFPHAIYFNPSEKKLRWFFHHLLNFFSCLRFTFGADWTVINFPSDVGGITKVGNFWVGQRSMLRGSRTLKQSFGALSITRSNAFANLHALSCYQLHSKKGILCRKIIFFRIQI